MNALSIRTTLREITPHSILRMAGAAAVRRRRAARLTTLLAAALAAVGLLAGEANANTPSDWSTTIAGTAVHIGWTRDHAWVIADYADVIKYGAGFVAGQLCSAASGEPGFPNAAGIACGQAAREIVGDVVAGHPALTDHGIWVAKYVIASTATTSGTW